VEVIEACRLKSPVADPSTATIASGSHRKSVMLVFCCTILGAAAQILMKTGANHLGDPGVVGIVTNIPLMTGYTLYGISTVLLVLALKDGELSRLYPIIALTYVWVTALSRIVFHDNLNAYRVIGVGIIVAGVVVLGRAEKS
jgi:multidrug transporter EmrE-like cation transporter